MPVEMLQKNLLSGSKDDLDRIVSAYFSIRAESRWFSYGDAKKKSEEIDALDLPALPPEDLTELMHKMISYTSPKERQNLVPGVFMSRMIQRSYDAGNNEFEFYTGDNDIPFFGSGMRGRRDENIYVKVVGDLGGSAFDFSSDCWFVVHGDVDSGLECIDRCEINIDGILKDPYFVRGKDSVFDLNDIGDKAHFSNMEGCRVKLRRPYKLQPKGFPYSERNTIILNAGIVPETDHEKSLPGNLMIDKNAKDNVFIVHDKGSYRTVKDYLGGWWNRLKSCNNVTLD